MRKLWSIALPLCGLGLFAVGAYQGCRLNQRLYDNRPARYFYWASIRLNSDPLNRHPTPKMTEPCSDGKHDCVSWEPDYVWIDAGWGAKAFILSTLPAFLLSAVTVQLLAHFGISEVTTFFVSMPLLIVAWFYLIGWWLDRRRHRRSLFSR